jgi:hypothetical protein
MKKLEAGIIAAILLSSVLLATMPHTLGFSLGVKSGDWIDYDLQESYGSEREQKIEFLSVAGTVVTLHVTVGTSAGTEIDQTETIDLASEDDFVTSFLTLRVYVIPANLGINDSVYLGSEIGNGTILGEATRTYVGEDRRTIYSNFSFSQNQYTLYWDKQTGILAEATISSGPMYKSLMIVDTNMWIGGSGLWLWVIIAIVVVAGIVASQKHFLGKLLRRIDVRHKKQQDQCAHKGTKKQII